MVTSLSADPLRLHPDLSADDRDWLLTLVGDWQLIADLSLADLVLWCPAPRSDGAGGYYAMAQARPVTAATLFHRDLVGSRARADLRALLTQAWRSHDAAGAEPIEAPDGTLQVRLWPVKRDGRVLAVLTEHRDPDSRRELTSIELNYRAAAERLLHMTRRGQWPDPADPPGFWIGGTPRVGDGLIVLDADARAAFASPNAVSALRRLGVAVSIEGQVLAPILTQAMIGTGALDEDAWSVLSGARGGRAEVQIGKVTIMVRGIVVRGREERDGALLMLRDVSELRRQEQRLVSKDATIREIHHRVKNNLQTVGSLLRMQARRATSQEARQALAQAMQRVDTIALVHQSLSEDVAGHVDVDALMARLFRLAVEVAGDGRQVRSRVEGEFGALPTRITTALALVINELATNAVEHGTGPEGGLVRLVARRDLTPIGELLEVEVVDSGSGHQPSSVEPAKAPLAQADGGGLGLRIVRTLVESELGGTLSRSQAVDGSTRVSARVPLD